MSFVGHDRGLLLGPHGSVIDSVEKDFDVDCSHCYATDGEWCVDDNNSVMPRHVHLVRRWTWDVPF